jgi:hypothetical protein
MLRRIAVGFLLLALSVWPSPSRADFVISIGSASIAQGGTGSIDVLLSSTASATSPDQINNLAFQLQIAGPNFLQFATSQDFSYLNAPKYAFFGDSTHWINGQTVPPPIGGFTQTTVYTNDTFAGSDSTLSTNPVSLDSSNTNTPVLLAVLTLDAPVGKVNVGDVYTISLVPSAGDGSMNTSTTTLFDNVNFSNGTEISSVPYTSTPGTVTIIAASIPEPSSIIMGLSAVALLAGARWIRGPWRSKR